MGFNVNIESHEEEVKGSLKRAGVAWLHEACGELEAQVKRNQRVRTGRTKGSWRYVVDEAKLEGYVASDAMNAVYEEFGTGEFALNGNGRKGGWWYRDPQTGKVWFTRGKKPHRPLYRAYTGLKGRLVEKARERFGSLI